MLKVERDICLSQLFFVSLLKILCYMIKRVENVENLKVGDEIMLFVVAMSI